jgi:transcriptional regulator with XRE-family HTH domain
MCNSKNMTGSEIVVRIDSVLSEKNIKRSSLAEAVGIAPNTFSAWKIRGNVPGGDILLQISEFLGVSLLWLMTGKEETHIPEYNSFVPGYRLRYKDGQIERISHQLHKLSAHDLNLVEAIIIAASKLNVS